MVNVHIHLGLNSVSNRRKFIALLLITFFVTTAPRSLAQNKPVTKLSAGTVVQSNRNTPRWNRVVLLATPKITSGDVDSLSAAIQTAATTLSLTVMATVTNTPTANGNQFSLREIGVGYSLPIAGRRTVVDSASQSQLGANLGFIQRRVLSQNETQLGQVKQIIQTTTMSIFDAPAIMHRNGKHRNYITRHLIWIDANTGQGAMLVWLLGNDASGNLRPANEPPRLVAHNTSEQRNIHVDGNEFTFSIPSDRAFALEDLPPGRDLVWTKELAAMASLKAYSPEQLVQLSAAVNDSLRRSDALENRKTGQ